MQKFTTIYLLSLQFIPQYIVVDFRIKGLFQYPHWYRRGQRGNVCYVFSRCCGGCYLPHHLQMVRWRQIVGSWPMALSPAIARIGNRKTPEVRLRGFSSSNVDYLLRFAYRHYSICRQTLQYTYKQISQ